MRQDRFLIIILVVIGLIAALALVTFFTRQGNMNYGPEDTPEGALRNYSLALQKKDYQRAYSYLADGTGKPDYDHFRQAFLTNENSVDSTAVQIGTATITGKEALVGVTLLHNQSDPFSGMYRDHQTAVLNQVNGAWKISSFAYPYWGWDWYQNAPKAVPAP